MDVPDFMRNLKSIFLHPQPFAAEAYVPGKETWDYLRDECRVLVVGAGGLGCEILKDLAHSGFRNIDVIDMDNVDISNLNRQFLFREKDVGRPKAEVAAEFINKRTKHFDVRVTPHVGKVQDFDPSFYSSFNIIIAGLDNIQARRWLNALLHDMVEFDENTNEIDISTVKPLLDGGTEGFKGQSRVILPFITSCFDCSLDSFPPQVTYPMCTIAETPRLPEHCIEYVMLVLWEKKFPGKKMNVDNPEDMLWLYERAKERAQTFGIEGVTYMLTTGVAKRIIPAVASTNALIAASLVNEAVKFATYVAPVLNNYFMYMGQSGIYTHTFEYAKKENCLVCSGEFTVFHVDGSMTLDALLEKLCLDLQLVKPSISSSKSIVFIQNPASLRSQHEHKLPLTLRQLVADGLFKEGEALTVTDRTLPSKLKLKILLNK